MLELLFATYMYFKKNEISTFSDDFFFFLNVHIFVLPKNSVYEALIVVFFL